MSLRSAHSCASESIAALNQSPASAAAAPFVRILAELFGPRPEDSAVGLPAVPLEYLFATPAVRFIEKNGGQVWTTAPATVSADPAGGFAVHARGSLVHATHVISAVPWHAMPKLWKDGVPDALKGEFDPHQVLIPAGWTMSVWASVPDARLAVWTPDGALLVSRPGDGQVVRLTPDGTGSARSTVLLDGLTQPHGLAFDGTTLYVAESNRIQAYTYAAGAAIEPCLVADGLPDSKSGEQ